METSKKPVVKTVQISSLNVKELIAMLNERNIPIEFPVSRKTLEDLLRESVDGAEDVLIINMNKSRSELIRDVQQELGSNEYPLVKNMKISSLTVKQLVEALTNRNVPIQYPVSRKTLEELMKAALGGSDTFVMVDVVNISSLADYQLSSLALKFYKPKKTIREYQQELAETCGYSDKVIWDLLSKDDGYILRNKIKQLIPDQTKGQKKIEKNREDMYKNVWAQRKYSKGNSVTSIFYVMVTKETNFSTARESTEFSCHPVIRCRKCMVDGDSSNCCMIYIDEIGRVYHDWKSFVEENILPAGSMITPRHGVYNFDRENNVILDMYCTPNGSAGAKVMALAQTGSAVLGMGAACVPIAALATPIAAPVVALSGLVGLSVGAFSAVSSAINLKDRFKHDQSISLTDSEARASYLGLAGGVVGMTANGATRIMKTMATTGKTTAGVELLVNGFNIANVTISGSGVVNGVLDLFFKFQDDEKISSMDLIQLSASLVLFTHSIYNFQLASQIANEARSNTIQSYRKSLTNRLRKSFDKMSRETLRVRGNTLGKIDIIRTINEIPDGQQLYDLFKNNKSFTKSFTQEEASANPLRSQTKQAAARLLMSKTGEYVTNRVNNFNLQDTLNNRGGVMEKLDRLFIRLENGGEIFLRNYGEKFLRGIYDGKKFEDIVLRIADDWKNEILKFILDLAKSFIDDYLDGIESKLQTYISTEGIIYKLVKFIMLNYRNKCINFLASKRNEIIKNVQKEYLSLPTNDNDNKSIKCGNCGGRYAITILKKL